MNRVREIAAHLGSALSQTIPSDDQIIMNHVRAANTLAMSLLKDERHSGSPKWPQSVVEAVESARRNHLIILLDGDAVEAGRHALQEQIEALTAVLQEIADAHIPDQPASAAGDELSWAQRHVGKLRGLAMAAIGTQSQSQRAA